MASIMRFDQWENTIGNKSVTMDQISGGSGLVPTVPTSVTVSSGTATVAASGLITLSGATQLKINACFPSTYTKFHIVYNLATVQAGSQEIYFRFRYSPTDTTYAASYYSGNFQAAYSNSFGVMELQSLGDHAWLGTANTNAASNSMCGQATVSLGTYSLMNFQGFSSQRSAYIAGGCEAPTATRPDGFFIYTSGGSQLNGTIQVYGYR